MEEKLATIEKLLNAVQTCGEYNLNNLLASIQLVKECQELAKEANK